MAFSDSASEVTCHHLGDLLMVTQVSPVQYGKDSTGPGIPGYENHRAILEASCHTSFLPGVEGSLHRLEPSFPFFPLALHLSSW